jgi:hypothetical protein
MDFTAHADWKALKETLDVAQLVHYVISLVLYGYG